MSTNDNNKELTEKNNEANTKKNRKLGVAILIINIVLLILVIALSYIQIKKVYDRNCDCYYNPEYYYEKEYKENFDKPLLDKIESGI